MNKRFDVIIIGAGIGGLTAGTVLSKKGYRVLILEKNHQPGGYCSSFRRLFFKFDSGAHLIGSCSEANSFGNLLKALDIKVDFVQLKPSDRFFFYTGRKTVDVIEVASDYHEFIRYLKSRFESEKANIDKFFDAVCKTGNSFIIPSFIRKYESFTYQKFLESYFRNKELIGILSTQCGFLGLRPNEVSAISAILMLKMFVIDGSFYPKGGAQELANAFANRFKDNGGTLLLSREVEKILADNNCVKGVLTNSKEIYESVHIISNIDCKRTFLNLLDSKTVTLDKDTATKLKSFKVGSSCFAIYAGLNNKLDLRSKNGWYYSGYDINKNFQDLLYIHIPTNYDSSVVAKEGYQIVILYAPFNFDIEKVKNWPRKKKELTKYYLARLERIFPGFSKNIITLEAATPKTFERYTLNSNGSLYGWKQTTQQVYLKGFSQKTSIKGLYLAGHWTVPGGGVVTVALSGMSAARYVMKSCNNMCKNTCIVKEGRYRC